MYRAIAAITVLLLAAVPEVRAGSALATAQASAFLDFAVVIPAMVRVEARVDPSRFVVTARDIDRGYVEMDEASVLTLSSNARSGFALSVAFDAALVRAVDVRLPGTTLQAAESGMVMSVHAGRMAARTIHVGYRIYLAAGARAGDYRWPVALTYSPGAA